MAEILKYRYNAQFLNSLCEKIKIEHPEFDQKAFLAAVFDENWDQKELKERMGHIAVCLHEILSMDFDKALSILKPVSFYFSGFEPMFFPDYVERYGQDEYDLSIDALAHFTKYSSSEFAVRPFIVNYPEKMMKQMLVWADSDNHHIRRLASEGCRPRLPWAISLPDFKKDPTSILPILEKLKDDESDYVRRSVANNLNDIAKDNPEVVIDIASRWLGQTDNTDKLVKHACRTLLKNGSPKAMALFSYAPPNDIAIFDFTLDDEVEMGGVLSFSFGLKMKSQPEINNESGEKSGLGKLRIEFAIHFLRSRNKTTKKVFKIAEGVFGDNEKKISKNFSFAKINTRKYYSGVHGIEIIVNGVGLAKKSFTLKKEANYIS